MHQGPCGNRFGGLGVWLGIEVGAMAAWGAPGGDADRSSGIRAKVLSQKLQHLVGGGTRYSLHPDPES